ncbi:ABC transporter ATP-binding protein [Nocardioides pacificus]
MSLELRGVEVRYDDVVAVHATSLVVPAGSLLAVTGPSGAGKTSLLWAVAGAVRPAAGEVALDGLALPDHHASLDAGVVLVPQGNGLARILTALENVLVPLPAPDSGRGGRSKRGSLLRERAQDALAAVGMAESGNHLVEELSGGQQQRVAIARGLAQRARVLLADEVTSELDPVNRTLVLDLLRREADRGATVLFATNDLEAAESCDAHAALDEGHLSWVRPFATHRA